jgi:large subunit ribosomal protein L13
MKTYSPKASEIDRSWYVIDADGLVLGRMAVEIARILRGKNKPQFAPHMDVGDYVIVVNASKVALTGNKLEKKIYYHHSGYPGGLKETQYRDLMEKKPEFVVRKAVRGMLPHNRLGRAMLGKLKVYAGPEHPHNSQQPQKLVLE